MAQDWQMPGDAVCPDEPTCMYCGKICKMSDEELNQKLKELELLHNVGPKADDYLEFLEENKEVLEKTIKLL